MTLHAVDTTAVSGFASLTFIIISAVVGSAWKLIRRHTSNSEITTISGIVSKAVSAAEQLGFVDKLQGAQKLTVAENRAIDELARHGITLTTSQLRTYIEAEVADLKRIGTVAVTPSAATDTSAVTASADAIATQIQTAAAGKLRELADSLSTVTLPSVPAAPVTPVIVPPVS